MYNAKKRKHLLRWYIICMYIYIYQNMCVYHNMCVCIRVCMYIYIYIYLYGTHSQTGPAHISDASLELTSKVALAQGHHSQAPRAEVG